MGGAQRYPSTTSPTQRQSGMSAGELQVGRFVFPQRSIDGYRAPPTIDGYRCTPPTIDGYRYAPPILRVTVPSVCVAARKTGHHPLHMHRQIQRRLVNRQMLVTRHTSNFYGGRGLRPQPCRPRRGTRRPGPSLGATQSAGTGWRPSQAPKGSKPSKRLSVKLAACAAHTPQRPRPDLPAPNSAAPA